MGSANCGSPEKSLGGPQADSRIKLPGAGFLCPSAYNQGASIPLRTAGHRVRCGLCPGPGCGHWSPGVSAPVHWVCFCVQVCAAPGTGICPYRRPWGGLRSCPALQAQCWQRLHPLPQEGPNRLYPPLSWPHWLLTRFHSRQIAPLQVPGQIYGCSFLGAASDWGVPQPAVSRPLPGQEQDSRQEFEDPGPQM